MVDAALKVVGIGSVGTRCFIVLMFSEGNAPLIPAVQGVLSLGAGAVCGHEPVSQPRATGGHGSAV
ncbi:DUF2252 family protein [Pseudomonas putida]|uniref:DUF2252 family protein n=1 Tax=Pseudomonas putida TaxID=303 RepID=UPI001E3578CA|nr:DUF2252 family protein [Pseudomonas putida]